MSAENINDLIQRFQIIAICLVGMHLIIGFVWLLFAWKIVGCIERCLEHIQDVGQRKCEIQEYRLELDVAQMLANNPTSMRPDQKGQGQTEGNQPQKTTGQDARDEFLQRLHSKYRKKFNL